MIPFFAALSMADIAFFRAVRAASRFLLAVSCSTFFARVLSIFFTDLFFSVRTFVCRALLRTDLLRLGAAFAGNRVSSFNVSN